ncbi:MAG: phosphoribosyltransferase family protein [Chitinophagales bacterium]
MNIISEHLNDFFSLFYPSLCCSCGKALGRGEDVICTFCQHYLPKTNFHLKRDNAIEKHFWGRVEIFRGSSQYYFQKGSRIQHLIHQLKYKGKTEVGIKLGMIYGTELRQSSDYDDVDVIVPVPLHKSKELSRGYNQVDLFCTGLSRAMEVPWEKNNLQRMRATETQTHKTRFERWENVGTVFGVNDAKKFEGRHVLLTDDVITTGSTLEACAGELLALAGTTVSIATIAYAMK